MLTISETLELMRNTAETLLQQSLDEQGGGAAMCAARIAAWELVSAGEM